MTDEPTTPEPDAGEPRQIDWVEARRLFEDEGLSYRAIADRVGCHHETVRGHAINERDPWRRTDEAVALVDRQRQEHVAAAAHATKIKWEERRAQEADAAGIMAGRIRQSVLAALEDRDWHMTRAASIAYGIFIDKAQLLSGGATGRVLTGDDLEAQVARTRQIRDEVAARRDKNLERASGE